MKPEEELSFIINELGEERSAYFNAVSPPIMQTSNFAFDKVEDLRKAFSDEMGGYLYSRGLNPTVDILRKKLAALDEAEDCLVFANGAAAIFAGILANLKTGDHIISVQSPYTWVQRMFDVILPRFGISTTYIPGKEIGEYEQALQPATRLIYLESPNSWNYSIQPLEEIARFAKQNTITTFIDNSYCTPLFQKPAAIGIDLCMQTATKYIGGHSDTLGGVLTGSKEMIKKIFDSEYLNIGSGIAPFNAWLLLRGLRTLPVRLERISSSTGKIVAWMSEHPAVDRILYPLHPSFDQYELALKQMKGAGGLFTFTLKDGTMEKITRFCESLHHFLMAVSWGGHESLILPKCAGISPKEFDSSNPGHQYIRMYVGLEDPEYLVRDIRQALDGVRGK
jgi:cystathionine beta-lyase/cystathionine gamma-synthase